MKSSSTHFGTSNEHKSLPQCGVLICISLSLVVSFIHFSFSTKLCIMASEENEEPIVLEQHLAGKYVIAFDPLDGSSVIDCNGSVGSVITNMNANFRLSSVIWF